MATKLFITVKDTNNKIDGKNVDFSCANDAFNILFTIHFIFLKTAQTELSMFYQNQYFLSTCSKYIFRYITGLPTFIQPLFLKHFLTNYFFKDLPKTKYRVPLLSLE